MWKASLMSEIVAVKLTIITAMTLKEAEKKFFDNPEIDIIVVDGCVPGRVLNTPPLVREIRKSFKGIMIAVSSVDEYRKDLLNAGCDIECIKVSM